MDEHKQQSGSLGRLEILGYIALCLIWGSTWLAIRVVVRDVPPFEAVAVRFLAAGALLLGMALLQKRPWPANAGEWNATHYPDADDHGFALCSAVLGRTICHFFHERSFVFRLTAGGLTHYSGGDAPQSSAPGGLCHGDGLRRNPGPLLENPSTNRMVIIGGAAVLVSMLLTSWSVVYAKRRLRNVDSVVATGLQSLLGSVVLFWGTWSLEAHRHAVWTRRAVVAMAFLTIFGSAAAFVIYYWLLKKLQPYQLSTISLIIPLVAILLGLLDGDRIPLLMLVAVVVVLGCVWSVLRAEADKEPEGDDILMLRDRS